MSRLYVLLLLISTFSISANEVEVLSVEFIKMTNEKWRVNTTLKHEDTGWDHYADAWRVLTEDGKLLGERILLHPHENEQPFTRSLQNLIIPKGIKMVFIEAHDKKHGWSKNRVKVNLKMSNGERFTVH